MIGVDVVDASFVQEQSSSRLVDSNSTFWLHEEQGVSELVTWRCPRKLCCSWLSIEVEDVALWCCWNIVKLLREVRGLKLVTRRASAGETRLGPCLPCRVMISVTSTHTRYACICWHQILLIVIVLLFSSLLLRLTIQLLGNSKEAQHFVKAFFFGISSWTKKNSWPCDSLHPI